MCLCVCVRVCELTLAFPSFRFLNTVTVILLILVIVPTVKDSLLGSEWGSLVVLVSESAFSESLWRSSEQQLNVGSGHGNSPQPISCTRTRIPQETHVGK